MTIRTLNEAPTATPVGAPPAAASAPPLRRLKRERPAVLKGSTRKMRSPIGDVFVTINEDEDGLPFEVFATLGKAGSIAMADTEAIGRLISLALRFGIPISEIHSQLRGISSDRAIGFGQQKVLSVPDAIAQAIETHEQERAGIQAELLASPAPTPVEAETWSDGDDVFCGGSRCG